MLEGQIMVLTAAANPVPALPAAPLAASSMFCEFIRPLLTTSQLCVSQSLLSCPGHDTEHAVQVMAMPMLCPGPLSLAGAQQNPISHPKEGPAEQQDKEHLVFCGTYIDSQPFTATHTVFRGFFVLAQKPLAALKPRQVCRGQRSWANDLQAAQELTGSRGLMVISTQITQTTVQSALPTTSHVVPTGKFIPVHQLEF